MTSSIPPEFETDLTKAENKLKETVRNNLECAKAYNFYLKEFIKKYKKEYKADEESYIPVFEIHTSYEEGRKRGLYEGKNIILDKLERTIYSLDSIIEQIEQELNHESSS